MSTHLISRNGHYHFRLRTPSDLLGIIPQREIMRSLKTADIRTAKATALPYLQGIRQTATLLRAKFITPEQAQESIERLLGRKVKLSSPVAAESDRVTNVEPVVATPLATVVGSFLKDKEHDWT